MPGAIRQPAPAYRPAPAATGAEPARLIAANEAACVFFREQLARIDGPRAYLTGRGLGAVVGRERPWLVGYAPPGWTTLTDHLTRLGFAPHELRAAGLTTTARTGRDIDLFRDRIAFPIRDEQGRTVAFIGRIWTAQAAADPNTPKYLNSPETLIYDKSRLLFGLAEQSDRLAAGWAPAVVEGPADTLAIWLSYSRTGRPGVVGLAPCGTALTESQAANIASLRGARAYGVTVAFDGDAAGRSAADRAFGLLRGQDVPLRGAEFAPDSDPGDLLLGDAGGRALLRYTLERRSRPLADVVVDHHIDRLVARWPRILEDIPGQVAAVRTVAPLIAELTPPEAVRLAKHVATRTGVGLDTVTSAVIDAIETSPSADLPARSAPAPPRPAQPAAGFPTRPAPGRRPATAQPLTAAAAGAAPGIGAARSRTR